MEGILEHDDREYARFTDRSGDIAGGWHVIADVHRDLVQLVVVRADEQLANVQLLEFLRVDRRRERRLAGSQNAGAEQLVHLLLQQHARVPVQVRFGVAELVRNGDDLRLELVVHAEVVEPIDEAVAVEVQASDLFERKVRLVGENRLRGLFWNSGEF